MPRGELCSAGASTTKLTHHGEFTRFTDDIQILGPPGGGGGVTAMAAEKKISILGGGKSAPPP